MKVGENVFVGTKGICKIEEIKKNPFVGCDKTKEYYVLKPFNSATNMVVFLPTDTTLKIRPLIPKVEAEKVLNEINNAVKDSNLTCSPEELKDILKEVDFKKRVNAFVCLANKKKTVSKKLFNQQEQKVFSTLFDCIVDEISNVLKKDTGEVKTEILYKLELEY